MSVDLISHGSMVLVLVWLVLGGLGIPLPEDAALLVLAVILVAIGYLVVREVRLRRVRPRL